MKLRFLCGNHSHALSQDSKRALICWQKEIDNGQAFSDFGLYKDALPHLGCAFEISEIILTTNATNRRQAQEIFTSSALMFGDALLKLGFSEELLTFSWSAVNRLERELSFSPSDTVHTTRYLVELYKYLQFPEYAEQSDFHNLLDNDTNHIKSLFH